MKIKIDFTIPVVLAIVFVVLRLCEVILWSWLWVLSPLWIGAIIDIVIILVFLIASSPRNSRIHSNTVGGKALHWDPETKEFY